MSYDNSELLKNYVHAYQATGEQFFAEVARDITRLVEVNDAYQQAETRLAELMDEWERAETTRVSHRR